MRYITQVIDARRIIDREYGPFKNDWIPEPVYSDANGRLGSWVSLITGPTGSS